MDMNIPENRVRRKENQVSSRTCTQGEENTMPKIQQKIGQEEKSRGKYVGPAQRKKKK